MVDPSDNARSRGRGSVGAGGDPLASLFKTMGGEDCDRPQCDDTKSALTMALRRVHNNDVEQIQPSTKLCPPSKDEIGSSTWTLLHSMAAWYPESPTSEERRLMSDYMQALARFYPCTWCASDFRKNVESNPPRTDNRRDLCMWLCDQHNIVNSKLGKPLFDCTLENLDERWRKSNRSSCN
mmetsp:Transcript_24593/g.58442  ORF Transcript_24593/g.58442 Transcript_24593/m.58442 type:complete len:181 (-) Transcript_24593:94-636(-)